MGKRKMTDEERKQLEQSKNPQKIYEDEWKKEDKMGKVLGGRGVPPSIIKGDIISAGGGIYIHETGEDGTPIVAPDMVRTHMGKKRKKGGKYVRGIGDLPDKVSTYTPLKVGQKGRDSAAMRDVKKTLPEIVGGREISDKEKWKVKEQIRTLGYQTLYGRRIEDYGDLIKLAFDIAENKQLNTGEQLKRLRTVSMALGRWEKDQSIKITKGQAKAVKEGISKSRNEILSGHSKSEFKKVEFKTKDGKKVKFNALE